MKLFHYHWWTTEVEAMEKFYEELGYNVALRLGKVEGEMKSFNPPLSWSDFRDENVLFRVIEQRKGQTNLTFGSGKKNIVDHIGFLVDKDEYETILKNATELHWRIEQGDKRTFISTPWKLRIELQLSKSYVTEVQDCTITRMTIKLPFKQTPLLLGKLFGLACETNVENRVVISNGSWEIVLINDEKLFLESIHFHSKEQTESTTYVDPVGTRLIINQN